MDNNIMEISFFKDSFRNVDSNDTDSDQIHKLNFSSNSFSSSNLISDTTQSSSNSLSSSNTSRKRKRQSDNNNSNPDTSPPNKKQRSSESGSSSVASLHPIHENNAMSNTNNTNKSSVASTNTANKNDKKVAKSYQQPLRRSARLKNKQANNNNIKICINNTTNASNEPDELDSISVPLSELKLKPQNSLQKVCKKVQISIVESKNNNNNNNNKIGNEWNDILCESISSKWNASATPIKSSLRVSNKTKQRIKYNKKVNWGNVKCRNYEQRCGILSCGVPALHSGPSLHLGKLISETTSNINQYNTRNKNENKIYNELPKKERIERVKQFCAADLNKNKLRQDNAEIKSLQKSRDDIGCKCVSIYKMKKNDIIGRIIYLDESKDKKVLCKLKKNDVFNILIQLQFDKYGRYDVCCIDNSCYCFEQGIECNFDPDCCECGGDIIYNNYLNNEMNTQNKNKNKNNTKKINKRDSLCCANPNGNTLNVSVLDYIENTKSKGQHNIAKKIESSILEFTSPFVQKRISEWNKHYDNDNNKEINKENKQNKKKDKVQKILRFD